MSDTEFHFTDDKYLFTFQDETKLWISKEFIKKHQQLPFYDIIKHSEKYGDGSYYIDILPFHIEKVISFLMDETMDISSLNLRDSYDIYKTFVDYPFTIDNEIQNDLLYHVKELFVNYLKENSYYKYYLLGLFSQQQKDDLLYYSLLFKMMNVIRVEIEYEYSSNIPVEYICPSCIKDIFPSLEELKITAITHYKKTNQLLNPNSDEYTKEYIRLEDTYKYKENKPYDYDYYTESEMNEYNKISSLYFDNSYYSHDSIDSYNGKRQKNELPKLYKYIVNEAIYTDNYSHVETSKTEEEYTIKDQVRIIYDDKANDKTFCINEISSKWGISQLLSLPSYLLISRIRLDPYINSNNDVIIFIKLLEEGVFDSLTILTINWIISLTRRIDNNLFNKVITTHVFPNVTELVYDDDDEYFESSIIQKECFPKLHIVNYNTHTYTASCESTFPMNLISSIDIIHLNKIDNDQQQKMAIFLDSLVYTHSIHIDGIDNMIYYFPHLKELLENKLISVHKFYIDSVNSENVKKLDYFENYKQNIDYLNISFSDEIYKDGTNKTNIRNSFERFFKNDFLQHLNTLVVSLYSYGEQISSEYLIILENIMKQLISMAAIITITSNMAFINRLIRKGCFHNTTQLTLLINDQPNDTFCELYTINNFPQLKSIQFGQYENRKWWCDFIIQLCRYIHNRNFPSSSIIQLVDTSCDDDYIYNPNTSILQSKYCFHLSIDSIIGTKEKEICDYEIETLFDSIDRNKIHNLKHLELYICDEDQLPKLIDYITYGKIPKLKEFICNINYDISLSEFDMYEKQLSDSPFIQNNHMYINFNKYIN
ncbi:hypothetical protein WA158_005160 [Blastocystis sp. Blastoise]